jgi:Ca2+-binding RTX toxin-like protein
MDTIQLKGLESDYIIGRQNIDLKIIEKANTNNRVTIKDFFDTSKSNQIEQFIFMPASTTSIDGSQISSISMRTYEEIVDKYHTQLPPEIFMGTANAETLVGSDGNDIIDGKAGDDIIYASNGHDEVYGSSGNDILSGNAGYDYIEGGKGNDEMYGGNGGDTYIINLGDGIDAIINADGDGIGNINTGVDIDSIKFMEGISANQLWFKQEGNNLDVSIIGTADKVSIKDWYVGGVTNNNQIDVFKTNDGKALIAGNVNQLVQAMASFAPPSMGQTTLASNYQTSLNTVITANWR